MREIRYLDKLIDELAKGKAMEKILRTWRERGKTLHLLTMPLELRPNCECCDRDLPPAAEAYICTFRY